MEFVSKQDAQGYCPMFIGSSSYHRYCVDQFYDFIDATGAPKLFTADVVDLVKEYRDVCPKHFYFDDDENLKSKLKTPLVLYDIYGKERIAWSPPNKATLFGQRCLGGLEIRYRTWENLSKWSDDHKVYDADKDQEGDMLEKWNPKVKAGRIKVPMMLIAGSDKTQTGTIRNFLDPGRLRHAMPLLQMIWQDSRLHHALIDMVKANVKSIRKIRRIVCSGLGCYTSSYQDAQKGEFQRFIDYFTVSTIASTLEAEYQDGRPIEVVAESGDYKRCDFDYGRKPEWDASFYEWPLPNEKKKEKEELERKIGSPLESQIDLPIKILSDLEAIKTIDENTLVIYARPENVLENCKASLYDLLTDYFEPAKWPAAILGPKIYKNKDDACHMDKNKMLVTPRVVEMLDGYDAHDFDKVKAPRCYLENIGYPSLWGMNFYFKKHA